MKNRTVRVSDELWEAAQEQAKVDDMDLSEAVRTLLRAYVDRSISIKKLVQLQDEDSDNE